MNAENLQLKEERDRHVKELGDMSDVGKRRDQELLRIEEELKTTSEELQKANAAKVICLIYAHWMFLSIFDFIFSNIKIINFF